MYLIGQNISHSNSPKLYNDYFKSQNINIEYGLIDLKNETEFKNFINDFKANKNIIGLNITMPYKNEVNKYIDVNDEISKICKSNNFVLKINNLLYGYNTDGIGLIKHLLELNVNIEKSKFLIIGSGGAGKSIISTLQYMYNIKDIFVIDHAFSKKLFKNMISINNLNDYNVIINASNAGFLNDTSLPIPKNIISGFENKNAVIIDIIYNPKITCFMKEFINNGFKNVYNGESMLKYQFLENIKLFHQNMYKF